VVVVVQAFPEGGERQEPEVGRVVREALVAEGVAGAVDRGVQQQVNDCQRRERHQTGSQPHQQHQDQSRQAEPECPAPQECLVEAVEREIRGVFLQSIVVVGLAAIVVDVSEHDLPVPLDVGAVGSPSTSLKLWCLRCTATHSLGEMLVSIQIPKRMNIVKAGWSWIDLWDRTRCK
jgi:hypothetical protein